MINSPKDYKVDNSSKKDTVFQDIQQVETSTQTTDKKEEEEEDFKPIVFDREIVYVIATGSY